MSYINFEMITHCHFETVFWKSNIVLLLNYLGIYATQFVDCTVQLPAALFDPPLCQQHVSACILITWWRCFDV